MPKRIVDGDALWRSQKLSLVQPPKFRAEFANLIPLALANGVFEADPDLIWSVSYSYNRPDVGRGDVVKILAEFERVGLLLRWQDVNGIPQALNGIRPVGKVWGYWIGIEKPGRLPGKSRQGKNERVGPTPPIKTLLSVDSIERSVDAIEQPLVTDSSLGSGSGIGSGLGKEAPPYTPSPQGTRLPFDFQITNSIRDWCRENQLPDPDLQFGQFVDYWNAVPGAKGRKADWPATFRNWMRRATDYGGGNGNTVSKAQQRLINNRKAIVLGLSDLPESGSGEPDLQDGNAARGSPRLAQGTVGRKTGDGREGVC